MRVDRIRGMLRKCEQLKTTRGVEKKRMCRAVCFLFLFPRPPLDHLRHLWSSSVPHRFVLSLSRESFFSDEAPAGSSKPAAKVKRNRPAGQLLCIPLCMFLLT